MSRPRLQQQLAGSNVTCFNANNGTITIASFSGGSGSYQFSINGGISWLGSPDFINLAPGSYDVRIRDVVNTNCFLIINPNLIITEPSAISASVASTSITCNGADDGTITITGAAGGYGTYEYSVNGGSAWQATGSFTALSPGFYNVQIRDAAHTGCVVILNSSLRITEPAALRATVTSTNVTCFGANDGTITITSPSGGYGTYEYSINGGSTWSATGSFTGLQPATFDVRIRDAAYTACESVLNGALVITGPAVLGGTVTGTNVTCFGANNGVISISNPAGGYGTYEYTVDGGVNWSTSGIFNNLQPGTYDVRIRDAAHTGCEIVLNAALAITQPAVLTASVTSTNVTCFGSSDGTISIINPAGGYGTYEYSINGGGSWNVTGLFTGLVPGNYNVRIRDAANNSCVVILNSALQITQPPVLNAVVTPKMVTCNGANDGIISITVPTGGYGTYEFSINGGSSWQSSGLFTNLVPGNYNVQIRDASQTGCVIILNSALAITQPAQLSAAVGSTNVTCFGANDGRITITSPTGGYGTYEYSINAGGSWQLAGTYTNLTPGAYDVRIRDAVHTGCIITLNPQLIITEPAALTATVNSTNVTCFGANNGIITITGATGGYGTYEYSINGGANWSSSGSFSNLQPATYDIRIRDALHIGCVITLNGALVITQPAQLAGAVGSTNVTCYGANDGTITISAPTGGYGTYEYSIDGGSNWQSSGNYIALAPGFYNVQIRDAAQTACIVTLNGSLRITEPAALSAAETSSNVTCFGANDGTITITSPTGGYGTYEYSVDGGSTWSGSGSFSNLQPATYDVRMRDAAQTGCIITLNPQLVITQPDAISASLQQINVTCFGANNGIITITGATGGYGTYEYSINGGTNWSGLNNFTNLAPGTYDVRIRDRAHTGCFLILNPGLVITEPAALGAVATFTNVTCYGANNGTITVSAPSGGYGTYEYSIDGGATWQSSGLFTGLLPSSYNVRIRDAANIACTAIINPALAITQPAALSATVTSTHITCFGASDGTITISGASGGYGTYEYTTDGGTTWVATGNFTALATGFYNVQVRDAANPACVLVLNSALRLTEPAVLNAMVRKTDITCFGANDGTITISMPTGGYGTYDYSIDGGVTWSGSGNFTSLQPATYDVRIRDAAHPGCVIILNPQLVITEPAALSAAETSSNVTCYGINDGTISITGATGGYGTYQYTINGGTTWSGSGFFMALGPGSYNVQMRDANNPACVLIINNALVITEPAAMNAVSVRTNITCFGAGDGTITISSPTGGYGVYEYTINGGGSWQSSGIFTGLGPGNYNVQMRDASHLGCVKVLNSSLGINQPAMLYAVTGATMITCNGVNDGNISITSPTGGYGTYEYSIDGGTTWQATGTFNSQAPGTYDIRLRDATQPACFVILNPQLLLTEPAILSANVQSTNVTCFGGSDGTINISFPGGGYGTYEYSINGGTSWQATGYFSGLAPGTYIVAIRDRAHQACEIVLNPALLITEPAQLAGAVGKTDVTCFGANDGTITISNPLGGYGTYAYSINGGGSWQNSETFTNLAPGTYDVRIRDAANPACAVIINPALVITQPGALAASLQTTNVTCYGASDGTITIASPTGGYGTYEYTINGGINWQSSGTFTALAPGYYNVQIRDAAHINCVIILNSSLRVTEPAQLAGAVGKTDITCFGANDGTITITNPTGGHGTYEYSIDAGGSWQLANTFSNLQPATYDVRIRDVANPACIITLNPQLVLTQPAQLAGAVGKTDVKCFGANDGTITITNPTGGYGTYEYSIDAGGSWQLANTYTNLQPATYVVMIRDRSHTGCTITLNPALVITQPAQLAGVVGKTDVTCFGANDGIITITNPTGGYGTYEYSINGGASWQSSGSFNNLAAGNYNVMIRDAAHTACTIVLNPAFVITQPAQLAGAVSSTNATCFGSNDGTITISTPTGGYGTYEYTINGGINWQSSGNFTALAPGYYNVQIRDAAHTNCTIILNSSLRITEPAALSAAETSSNVTCFGANDGTITITGAIGGHGTYEYSIDGGLTWSGTGTFSNLAPRTYDIRIRDAAQNGCVITLNPQLLLTEPVILNAVVTSTDVTCNGANNGTITISTPTGGYGTYDYSIDGGIRWQSSGTFSNLQPATYDVRIRDAAHTGCVITLNPQLVVTQPVQLAGAVGNTDVTCFGANDGTITITNPTGGYGTYEYSINGGAAWQASGSYTGLGPGYYNIQIRDAAHANCVIILNSSLRITEPQVLTAVVSRTNVTCFGSNDGTITINGAAGGHGTYEYSVDGGANWSTSGSFINLQPATYDLRLRDASQINCFVTLTSQVITEPASLSAAETGTDVTCFGAVDGRIVISGPAGGSGTYLYSINGGTSWQGSGTFNNLAIGTYDVRIRDGANALCIITLNPALVLSQPPVLNASVASTNVTCFGGNDGTITISSATGGYGTYEFTINGGGSWQPSGSFSNLAPGTYNVMIRDAAHTGCVIVLNSSYIITQPGMLSATISKTEITCRGNNDGTITITSPAGGYGTYEYSINGGISWQVTGNFTNLAPGLYDIRIRDAANQACAVILYPNLIITEPLALAMSSTGDITLDCFGDTDGMGTFYVFGGTMPYSFIVDSNTTGGTVAAPGFNSLTFFSAGAGSITVTVVDLNGCSAQGTINVVQPALLDPGSIAADQVVCFGDSPATLTGILAPSGGPGAYIYQWQSAAAAAGPFFNIAAATANSYTPPAGVSYTIYYRRMVTSGLCAPVYSNVVEVRVNPLPIALLTGGETICPGQSSVLKVNLPAGTGPFTLYIENLGMVDNYTSGSDIIVTPAVTTTYRLLEVRDANNCDVMAPSANLNGTATVIVSTLPSITSFTPSPAVCEFALAKFSVVAAGTNLTYQWYVNEGSGFNPVADGGTYFGALTPVLQIFNSVRTMNGYVYHVVVTGCGNNVTSPDAVFTVNTAAEITQMPADTTICLGQNAIIQANADGTSVTWQWYVNKGAGFIQSVDDAWFSGSTTRTLTITNAQSNFNNWFFRATATGICGAPTSTNLAVLRVLSPPTVTLQPISRTICENGNTSFQANGRGYLSMQWQEFSGGVWTNLTENATYLGTNSQMLNIIDASVAMNGNQYRLALTGSCTVIYTNPATLTVNANPVVDFSAVDPIAACGGVPLILNGNPSGGSGTYTQHNWTGDVGPLNNYSSQSPIFNSVIAADYNLNYRVTDSNGCTSSDDVVVKVDVPSAQFTQDVNFGCTPLDVTFTKDMTGLTKWWWDFNDGSPVDSVSVSPVHTFTNSSAGSIEYYDVKLRVQSAAGCFDEFTSTITVFPGIDATFAPNDSIICSGTPVILTAMPGASRYFWDYGDGVSGYSTNVSNHLYTNYAEVPVVNTVTLVTTSFFNCTDIKTFDITVMPVPVPQFTADPVNQVFNPAGTFVTFTNTTNPGTWSWLWKFGDNTTSTQMNQVHRYDNVGSYSITLIASNSECSDSIMHYITIVPPAPVAMFDTVPSGCAPLFVNLNNTSINTEVPGTTYRWDFGDGSTSTAKNPTYTYFTPGNYRIELTVSGPGGVSVMSRVIGAYASPLAHFEVAPSEVYVNDVSVRFFNLTPGDNSYIWDFGDGDTSKVKEPFHKYMSEGIYDVTLWAYSENGCSDMYLLSPAVKVLPVGDIRYPTVFIPNKTGPIERTDLPTSGSDVDMFFYPPIRQTVTNYKLQIFNRWGVLIFESHDINVPWNGYYKGELCQQGVYVWLVEGKYQDGKPFKKVGNVTLLH